ncbi:MAG: hypothetical protein HXY22_08820 [Alphaproteobacteria bacterium]|nr:hypothetical protein [Alphaproteobacteria bacterium]
MKRRLTAIVVYAAYPALAAALLTGGAYWPDAESFTALACALAAAMGVAAFMRMQRSWMLGNAPDRQLDEREIQLRLRAYYWSYVTFVTLVFVGLVVTSFVIDLTAPLPFTYAQLSVAVWGVFLVGLTLPTALIAWVEDDTSE